MLEEDEHPTQQEYHGFDWRDCLQIANTLCTLIAVGIAALGLWQVGRQLTQTNDHQKWGNSEQIAANYRQLQSSLYSGDFKGILCPYGQLGELTSSELAWIHSFFDLLSEAYWLDQEGLLPPNYFEEHILPKFTVGFQRHPALIQGYLFWRDNGAFTHPNTFNDFLESTMIASQVLKSPGRPSLREAAVLPGVETCDVEIFIETYDESQE